MRKDQFFKDIHETILEEIFLIQPDEIIEPDSKIVAGEEILGKMTHLEKCIYSVMSQKREIMDTMMCDLEEKIKSRLTAEQISPEELPENIGKIIRSTGDQITKLFELFSDRSLFKRLLAAVIESRLKVDMAQKVGVRRGFVIVAENDNSSEPGDDKVSDQKCADCEFKSVCDRLRNDQPKSGFCMN